MWLPPTGGYPRGKIKLDHNLSTVDLLEKLNQPPEEGNIKSECYIFNVSNVQTATLAYPWFLAGTTRTTNPKEIHQALTSRPTYLPLKEAGIGIDAKIALLKLYPREKQTQEDKVYCIFLGCAPKDVGQVHDFLKQAFSTKPFPLDRRLKLTPNPCDTALGSVYQTVDDSIQIREAMKVSVKHTVIFKLTDAITNLDSPTVEGGNSLRSIIQGIRHPHQPRPIFITADTMESDPHTVALTHLEVDSQLAIDYGSKLGMILAHKYGDQAWRYFTRTYKAAQTTQYVYDEDLGHYLSTADQMQYSTRPKNWQHSAILLDEEANKDSQMTIADLFKSPVQQHDPIRDAKIRPTDVHKTFSALALSSDDASIASSEGGLSGWDTDASALSGIDTLGEEEDLMSIGSGEDETSALELEGFPKHVEEVPINKLPKVLPGDQILEHLQDREPLPLPSEFEYIFYDWYKSKTSQQDILEGWSQAQMYQLAGVTWSLRLLRDPENLTHPKQFFTALTPRTLGVEAVTEISTASSAAMDLLGITIDTEGKIPCFPESCMVSTSNKDELTATLKQPDQWDMDPNEYVDNAYALFLTSFDWHTFELFAAHEKTNFISFMQRQPFSRFSQLVQSTWERQLEHRESEDFPTSILPIWCLHVFYARIEQNPLDATGDEQQPDPDAQAHLREFLSARCTHSRQALYQFPKMEVARALLWMGYLGHSAQYVEEAPPSISKVLQDLEKLTWAEIQDTFLFKGTNGLKWCPKDHILLRTRAPREDLDKAQQLLDQLPWYSTLEDTRLKDLIPHLINQAFGWPNTDEAIKTNKIEKICSEGNEKLFILLQLQVKALQNIKLYSPPPDEGATQP